VIRPKRWYRLVMYATWLAMFAGFVIQSETGWKPTGAGSSLAVLVLLAVIGPVVWNSNEIYRAYSGDLDAIAKVTSGRRSLFERVERPNG
jgi:hypothetical protein